MGAIGCAPWPELLEAIEAAPLLRKISRSFWSGSAIEKNLVEAFGVAVLVNFAVS